MQKNSDLLFLIQYLIIIKKIMTQSFIVYIHVDRILLAGK